MKYFNCGEVQKILNVTGDLRFKLLFEFLFRSGARISEALALSANDLDLSGHVNIRCLKKRGSVLVRLVPIVPAFIGQIAGLVVGNDLIWPFSRVHSHNVLKLAMSRAGFNFLDKRSHHAFRHGFAKTCLDQGVDLRDLQRYLGHSSISITSNYLQITDEYLTKLHGVKFLPSNQLTLLEGKKS